MSPGKELLWHVLNFALVLAVLVYFGRKPVKEFLIKRRRAIARAIEEATESREQSRAELDHWLAKLERIDEEAAALVREWVVIGGEKAREIIARAEATAERIRQDAHAAADSEVQAARAAVRRGMVERALQEAEAILRSNVRGEDHDRFFQTYVDRLRELPT